MSFYALKRFLAPLTETERSIAIAKTKVVYPSVMPDAPSQDILPATEESPLTVVFVGRDFFRKGGESVLRAIEQVGDDLNVRATIVSSVDHADYATRWVTDRKIGDIQRRLARERRVTWHRAMPRREIAHLMSTSHVVALPSLADTFGYSLAEGAVMGALPFSSSAQALPEIAGHAGQCVTIDLDTNKEWRGDPDREGDYDDSIHDLTAGLISLLASARTDPERFAQRRAAARLKSRKMFGRERDDQLRSIYEKAGLSIPPSYRRASNEADK
ncbi:glycosyltransferase [Microbacterium sp. F1-18]